MIRRIFYEQKNDMFKYDLAVAHGYEYNKNYFVIDCRQSKFDYIKNSIEKSPLGKILNLENVDWEQVNLKSEDPIIKEVCERYNETKMTTNELAKEFSIDRHTVRIYLKKGKNFGWCDYDPKIASKNRIEKISKSVVYIKDGVIEGVYSSGKKCGDEIGYFRGINQLASRKGMQSHKPTHFVNSRTHGLIGFYYLDSQDWEKDKHLYQDVKGLLAS